MRRIANWGIGLCVVLVGTLIAHASDNSRGRATMIRRAVAAVTPSIVTIETIGGAQPVVEMGRMGKMEESFKLAEGPTTGVILSSDGLIVTSSFNFAREPSVITVTLADGRRFVAKLLGRDFIRRTALVKIDASEMRPATWLRRDEIAIGQYAIACGRGFGGTTPHVSLGIVSALERRTGNALQTDAKLSPVNYGGPLIDLEGRVLGLIVPIAGAGSALAGAEWYDSGIGFAIYRDRIDLVFDRLMAGQNIEPGKIGVILEPDEPEEMPLLEKLLPVSGVKIAVIAPKSPAATAGLKEGDRILALDGQPIGDILDLQRRLSDRAAGEDVKLSLKRRWQTLEITVRLAKISEIEGLEPPKKRPPKPEGGKPEEPPPTTEPAAD
jgi:serine protease Do